jgi:hypothetical protein
MSSTARLRTRLPAAPLLASIAVLIVASPARAATPWPHEIKTSKGSLLSIYEPRIESLKGDQVGGQAACSIRPSSGSEPVFGVFWFSAAVQTDTAARTVKLLSIMVTKTRFPDQSAEVERGFAALVERDLPGSDLSWSLDWMNASLEATKDEQAAAAKISNAPPAIVVSTEPAVLIQFDGEPQLRPAGDTDLMRVVNTPYFVVYDPKTKRCYLGSEQFWYEAREALGPWSVIANPPPSVLELKPDDAGASVSKSGVKSAPPRVITATKPTELIVFAGKPEFRSVQGTELLHVANSDKDVFMDVPSQTYCVLLSGRWFTAKDTDGPWGYVAAEKLPAGFASLPTPEFERVLASVPGTKQAEEAVLAAQVPKVTAVPKGRADDFEVWYDGDPKFKRISGTSVDYAVNASVSVFRTGGKYFACDQGIWYVSDGWDGPWYVSDTRPEEMASIPPDNPHYNTKYVYIYDSTPTEIYVGYTPGYVGCYPYHGAVYYGTGYWYDPWYGPAYYAYPWTWGLGVTYAPYGGWGFSFGFGTGFAYCGMTWGWGYCGWPYYGYPYYGYGYYPGYGYCGGWYGPGGYYPVYEPYRYYNQHIAGAPPASSSAMYGTTRARSNVAAPASIYDRGTSRYRKDAQYSRATGRQSAASQYYNRYAPRSGGKATTQGRYRSTAPAGSRSSTPGRYRNEGYARPQGDYRYRDRTTAPRSGSRAGEPRGYQYQPRSSGSQYRSMTGGQSYGRGSSGGGGSYGRGGGGAYRGGGGGGGGRHR